MTKVLTGIPASQHAGNVLTRVQQGPVWRKQAAPLQPRTPRAHTARGGFAGATRMWAGLSPDNQAAFKTLAAASQGRYRSGYALFMAISIISASGGIVGPPASYVEGGSITSADFTIDDFGDMPLTVSTTNEAQDEVLSYFLPYARQTHYSFTSAKAKRLPLVIHAGQTNFIETIWPTVYGPAPPYSQRIVGWFQAVNATTGIPGPMRQFVFTMPNQF